MRKKIVLYLSLFLAVVTRAEEPSSIIDKGHEAVSSSIMKWSDSIDSLFGVERLDKERRGSRLRIESLTVFTESEDASFLYKVRFRLALPKTEKKLNLVIDNLADSFQKNDEREQAAIGVTSDDRIEDSDLSAALRYFVLAGDKWNLNTDLGMKLRLPLDPFFRIRVRREWDLENWVFRVSDSLFWFEQRGLGQDFAAEFDRRLSGKFLFRWSNRALWTEDNDAWSFSYSLNLLQRLSDKDALSYSAGINSTSRPVISIESYGLGLSYRRNVYNDWLFLSVNPNISYPKAKNFTAVPSIAIQLEMRAGDIK